MQIVGTMTRYKQMLMHNLFYIVCIPSSLIMNNPLKIMLYDSRGLGGINCEMIRQFLDNNNPDIILMRETWLSKNNLQMLSDIHNDYMINHGKSSVPDDKIISGKPYGRLGSIWRKIYGH